MVREKHPSAQAATGQETGGKGGPEKQHKKSRKPFNRKDNHGIIPVGESPANLDNFDCEKRAQTDVQMTREMTTANGCHVTLIFPAESKKNVRREIAGIFLAAVEKGMEES